MKLNVSIFLLIILLSINAAASGLHPGAYWNHQRVDFTNEDIYVNKDKLDIIYLGALEIDDSVYNDTSWISFFFYPETPLRDNEVMNLSQSLDYDSYPLGNGNQKYSEYNPHYKFIKDTNFSYYTVNVSLAGLSNWNTFYFRSNFSLINKINKIRKTEYSFYYKSTTESDEIHINFHFPNKYEILHSPEGGVWKYGSTEQIFKISGKNAKEPLYFVYIDNAEVNKLNQREKSLEKIWALLFTMTGFGLAVIYEESKKNKRLEGEITIKKYKNHDIISIKVNKIKKNK